ncbi:unnamed protein product [Phytomonas sp. EM1]|nr:unnamed protein product [Phytomonas sp. EM1]|eukprot:CCW60888.1 unnamed protein product [Phytomonas sp. isolate EM1]
MSEIEGLIRYRLLGSHPAASGRYLTLGFPGDTITASRLLHAVITEHQINLSTFKLSTVKLLSSASTNHTRKTDGTVAEVETEEAVPVHETDTLHTYDVLAITVSKRSLMDHTTQETTQRLREQKQLIKEMESQMGIEVACTSSTSIDAIAKRDDAYAGSSKPILSSSPADPLSFERSAALAMKTFPVMRGKRGSFNASNEDTNAHSPRTCALCDLDIFCEIRTACCDSLVCGTCLEAARGMTMADGECPVCGRIGETAAQGSGSSDIIKHEREDVDLRGKTKIQKLKLTSNSSCVTNKSKPLASFCGIGGERSKEVGGIEGCHSSNTPTEGGRRWLPTVEDSWERVPRVGRSLEDSRGCNTSGLAEIPQIEHQLQNDLDQILSYLDVPDPLTEDAKARRKRSEALIIMDDQILQI